MYSKATFKNHAIHPMLIGFPIAMYTLTVVTFAVYDFSNASAFWYRLGYFANMAGLITAVVAAVPGLIDWTTGIPKDTEAKARGLVHMSLNSLSLLLFAVSAYLIRNNWNIVPDRVGAPLLLSFIGLVLTGAAGYYGWDLVARNKVGVNLTPEQERIEPTAGPLPSRPNLEPHHV